MYLKTVQPADLMAVWPTVLPWIREACVRGLGDQTPADLLLICLKGEGALLLVCDAAGVPRVAGVTQIRDYADGRSCWILAAGGSGRAHLRHALAIIEANAARIGCNRVEFTGRRGWARLLPGYGPGPDYVKRLEPVLSDEAA